MDARASEVNLVEGVRVYRMEAFCGRGRSRFGPKRHVAFSGLRELKTTVTDCREECGLLCPRECASGLRDRQTKVHALLTGAFYRPLG
jgi:hypothetical protein